MSPRLVCDTLFTEINLSVNDPNVDILCTWVRFNCQLFKSGKHDASIVQYSKVSYISVLPVVDISWYCTVYSLDSI